VTELNGIGAAVVGIGAVAGNVLGSVGETGDVGDAVGDVGTGAGTGDVAGCVEIGARGNVVALVAGCVD